MVSRVKGDPWCLGYFVDNELSWGGFGEEGGRYGLGLGALSLPATTSPAKRPILDQLKKKYADISQLNNAWKTDLSGWRGARAFVEAGRRTGSLDGRIQGRSGCVRQGAGPHVLQDGAQTGSRPPIPTIFTLAAGLPGVPRKPSPRRPSFAT